MKVKKRSFKDWLEESKHYLDWKGFLFIVGIILFFSVAIFVKRKTPSDYGDEVEAKVTGIKERIIMTQSKHYGIRSEIAGWDVKWNYSIDGRTKTDSILVLLMPLSKSQKIFLSNLKVNSIVKVKYNKEGKNFLEIGE